MDSMESSLVERTGKFSETLGWHAYTSEKVSINSFAATASNITKLHSLIDNMIALCMSKSVLKRLLEI
jgi:hypothetical protein